MEFVCFGASLIFEVWLWTSYSHNFCMGPIIVYRIHNDTDLSCSSIFHVSSEIRKYSLIYTIPLAMSRTVTTTNNRHDY